MQCAVHKQWLLVGGSPWELGYGELLAGDLLCSAYFSTLKATKRLDCEANFCTEGSGIFSRMYIQSDG